jgi:hypothetical protein
MAGSPKIIALQPHALARGREERGPALDLVARLFEHFARDAALAPAVGTELARLRICTLRAAQRVPDFLGDRAHPARRLLDAIGAAALGLDDAAAADDPGVMAVAKAVQAVLERFEDELGPFEEAAAALEEFVARRTHESDEAARPIVQAIVQRETAALPRRAAAEEVERRLAARLWVPPAVRTMLREAWVEALATEYRQHGEGSERWHARVRTMDELLWSVEPKASPEGRRRLAAVLPELVDAIVDGLERAGMDDHGRSAFLSSLVDCHAHAMKAGMRGLAVVPDPEPIPDPAGCAFAIATHEAGPRRFEEVRLARARNAPPDAHDELVARLRLGSWLGLERGGRAAVRKRLAWSSPITGGLLLVGLAPTATGVAISPEALAEKLRRGEASVLDARPLVERALLALAAGTPTQG